jgi:hypothetical protein
MPEEQEDDTMVDIGIEHHSSIINLMQILVLLTLFGIINIA